MGDERLGLKKKKIRPVHRKRVNQTEVEVKGRPRWARTKVKYPAKMMPRDLARG